MLMTAERAERLIRALDIAMNCEDLDENGRRALQDAKETVAPWIPA